MHGLWFVGPRIFKMRLGTIHFWVSAKASSVYGFLPPRQSKDQRSDSLLAELRIA